MKNLRFNVQDLKREEYKAILDRAEERVKEALLGRREVRSPFREEIEILSFPVSIIMVSAMNNQVVKRRFADFEAKRITEWLRGENCENLIKVAKNFNWRIRALRGETFALHFVDYLKNAVNFNEAKWKLVNRTLSNGEVRLSRSDVARLLEEEVRRYIENKLDVKLDIELPEALNERVENLTKIASKEVKRFKLEEVPKELNQEAFPPCIKRLYEAVTKGLRVSHIGRFTLTSFLLNIGLKPEEIITLFTSSSDFNERMTRYQVEHIAGVRGSKTRYTSPKCSTLQTHRLCIGKDELCNRVRHPLTYYRIKYRMLKKEAKRK
ncbi:DNA primase large subunit PriL [Candidatus Bathyarchaeota archaeon]|nr:DNA primase large subunit PriL [Candidatus Bathyarchaeota archaeon]